MDRDAYPAQGMSTIRDHMEDSSDEGAPPLFSRKPRRNYSQYELSGRGLDSSARITEDGRITVALDLKQALPDLPSGYANSVREFAIDPQLKEKIEETPFGLEIEGATEGGKIPRLSIVLMIVGSRGDVQPYLALGQELLRHGHRVRVATHGTFRQFVADAKLEFFDVGGDPQELMSYMVRNPGLIPGFESLTNGDITRNRTTMSEILNGCWKACTQADGPNGRPFIADAIIANPPSFAHIHIAEALGIPLQVSFTMPWCPTTAFPHPLVNISQSNAEPGLTNYLSYALAEMVTWQGLGDLINEFRIKTLGLEPLSVRSGPGILDRLKIPWTYCFSPEIVKKPEDWKNHIDVVGFYFLDLATDFIPPPDLITFLNAGPPPVYIGFGSVVVKNPAELTQVIFEATRLAGVRAVVSPGWGGLASPEHHHIPPHVFILPNIPHDWLFTRVSAVCHHGGAGTTAIGLRLGKPTIVVPFFGDQPFWGRMVQLSGAGPYPIKPSKMSVERLKVAIEFCMGDGVRKSAEALGEEMRKSNGIQLGVNSFYQHLPVLNMRCDLLPERLAVWWSTKHCMRLCTYAAQILTDARLIELSELELHRSKEYESRAISTDPLSGGVVEIFRTIVKYQAGIAQIFYSPVKGIINTTIAIPSGIVHILDSMHEGMHNTPKLYGSKVREKGKVTDFQSGVKEGGMGLFRGYYDGITGLWKEPMNGMKQEGFAGFVKGSARSYINATIKPAAGIIGVVSSPMRGAWLSLSQKSHKVAIGPLRTVRLAQGKQDAEIASTGDRQKVIEVFKLAMRKDVEKARRKTMEERLKSVVRDGGAGALLTEKKEGKENDAADIFLSGSTSKNQQEFLSPHAIEVGEQEARFQKELEEAIAASTRESQDAKRAPNVEAEEERVERETKIAMALSLKEEDEFERGLMQDADCTGEVDALPRPKT